MQLRIVRPALEATLHDLRTPYLDLYLVSFKDMSKGSASQLEHCMQCCCIPLPRLQRIIQSDCV